jgi:hypothetical protein
LISSSSMMLMTAKTAAMRIGAETIADMAPSS